MKTKRPFLPIAMVLSIVGTAACKNNTSSESKKTNSTIKNETKNKKDKNWAAFPEFIPIDSLKNTAFAYTLESPIQTNKNSIYTPALLYAWQGLKEQLKSNFVLTKMNSRDFKLLTNSKSYKDALDKSEYSVKIVKEDDGIYVHSFFNKTLPFEYKFNPFSEPMLFNNEKVKVFGMNFWDFDLKNQMKILYYKDDDHFAIKLLPADKKHEIILTKGLDGFKDLAEALNKMEHSIKLGREEMKQSKYKWKYNFDLQDQLKIPKIKFNLLDKCDSLKGETFLLSDQSQHLLADVYFRIGFILNENGAAVESEAAAAADSMGEKPKPKLLFFDKPFLVVVRHVNAQNPYFVMHVANADLLEKQQ